MDGPVAPLGRAALIPGSGGHRPRSLQACLDGRRGGAAALRIRAARACQRPKEVDMVGALLLRFVCGVIARLLMPGDAFRHMSGPASWAVSLGLGLAGAL